MKRDWKETDPTTHYYYDETGRVLSKVYEKDQLWVTVGADLNGKLTCEKGAFVNLESAKRNIESSWEDHDRYRKQVRNELDEIHLRETMQAKNSTPKRLGGNGYFER